MSAPQVGSSDRDPTAEECLAMALYQEDLARQCRALPGDPAYALYRREAQWWLNEAARLELEEQAQ